MTIYYQLKKKVIWSFIWYFLQKPNLWFIQQICIGTYEPPVIITRLLYTHFYLPSPPDTSKRPCPLPLIPHTFHQIWANGHPNEYVNAHPRTFIGIRYLCPSVSSIIHSSSSVDNNTPLYRTTRTHECPVHCHCRLLVCPSQAPPSSHLPFKWYWFRLGPWNEWDDNKRPYLYGVEWLEVPFMEIIMLMVPVSNHHHHHHATIHPHSRSNVVLPKGDPTNEYDHDYIIIICVHAQQQWLRGHNHSTWWALKWHGTGTMHWQ